MGTPPPLPGGQEEELHGVGGTQADVARTIDSARLAPSGAPAGPETVREVSYAQTIAAESIPSDLATQIGNTWVVPGGSRSNPLMTIKGRTEARVTESTLVVQRRALRAADEPDAGNADYQLLEKLGEGGMGYVYLARQAAINRVVALKMLKSDTGTDAEQRLKFLSEAVVTGDLDHPNIVPIYDLGTSEHGVLFYSMKRVQGTPWMQVMGEKSLQENLEILMKVADAVAFAHARGVVHRDLKPENVMLGEFGEVLLLDWGLAVPTSGFAKSGSVTRTTAMGGTPAYMAPEMATGPADRVGPASDIYLLGAILYEIVTGRQPHAGKDVMECLLAAAKNEIVPTTKTGELVDIAKKAMATRPEDRYATVIEFQDAIRTYLSHTESIALASRAAEGLARARQTDDYQDYARALFAFQEASALWEGNVRAKEGVAEASFAYAESAARRGDYDLAASLLDPAIPPHAQQLTEIQAARRECELRQKRLRRLALVTRAGLVAFLVVVSGASWWIWREKEKARAAERVALLQRTIAVEEKHKADVAKDQEAAARSVAETEKRKADAARDAAIAAEQAAVVEREKALAAQREEERQRKETEYQAYVAQIGLAAAKIDENAFDLARQLLDACPPALRHWEWRRLRYMCQLSVRDVAAGSPVESIAASPAGILITGGWKGLARIWDGASGQLRHTLQHEGQSFVHSAAISPVGAYAATGSNDRQGGSSASGTPPQGRRSAPSKATRMLW